MQKIKLEKGDALIIVDVQNDFMPWGSLPVPDSDKIIYVLNDYINIFSKKGLLIIASRDWHPENHCSFKEYGGIWPKHCVKGTKGADFPEDLRLPKDTIIISKATSPEKEAYSALQETGLSDVLKDENIRRCFVGGIATEYCVFHTVEDLLKLGIKVYILEDAIKEVKKEDGERAKEEMKRKGAIFIVKENIL